MVVVRHTGYISNGRKEGCSLVNMDLNQQAEAKFTLANIRGEKKAQQLQLLGLFCFLINFIY